MPDRDSKPHSAASETAPAIASTAAANRIGPYRLLERLGAGGMGEVWLADQTEPVRRRVAVKLIKLGMDTREVIARFEAERQALALMNHPHIAGVLDAGATPEGRPYFVMEYVPGEAITTYCDRNRLSLPERLELFIQVCNAVQHAHQKAVIHRDLKPGNILVSVTQAGAAESTHASSPSPQATVKIIDFGVAKATNQRLAEHTIYTQLGMLIGTPEYMSPEQAEMSLIDIDTRTDIYALGVLLYELLTGTMPFEPQTLRRAPYADIQRIIREVEPRRPSTRLEQASRHEQHAPRQGRAPSGRNQDPGLGTTQLGNLQRAVGDALGSAPTAMQPETPRGGIEMARSPEPALAELTLEKIAERRRLKPETLVRTLRGELDWIVMKCLEKDRTRRYETANALAMEIRRYLNDEPVMAGPPSTTYRVKKFVRRNRGAVAAGGALVVALALGVVGTSIGMAQARAAERQTGLQLDAANVARAAEAREREIAESERKHAQEQAARATAVTTFLTDMFKTLDPRATREAEVNIPELLDKAVERIDVRFQDQPLTAADVRESLGALYGLWGRYATAEGLFRESMRLRSGLLGPDCPENLPALSQLGLILKLQDKLEEAEAACREAAARCRQHYGLLHEQTLTTLSYFATVLKDREKNDEAEIVEREALAAWTEKFGDRHDGTLASRSNLATILIRRGNFAEAVPLLEKVYAANRALLGEDHPITLIVMSNLGQALAYVGRAAEGEALMTLAIDICERALGPDHALTAAALNGAANVAGRIGHFENAIGWATRAVRAYDAAVGSDHQDAIAARQALAALYINSGRLDDAEPLVDDVIETSTRVLGAHHPKTLAAIFNRASLDVMQNDMATAAEVLESLVADADKHLPRGSVETEHYRSCYGMSLFKLGKFADAEPLLLRSHAGLAASVGESAPQTRDVAGGLVQLYEAWHAAQPDKGYDAKARAWREKIGDSTNTSKPSIDGERE